MEVLYIAIAVLVLLTLLVFSFRVVRQWERGVVFRLGRLVGVREPGLRLIIPLIDRMTKVDMRIVTYVLEPQEVITKDNVTIKVDAVVYFQVLDPAVAVVAVETYVGATVQIALATLRSVLGQSDLDEVLAHRDEINARIRQIIDDQTEKPWGVLVRLAEVKDVLLPEIMQRSMANQAEAERERRAKVIHALGEREAAVTLTEAADILSRRPAALQLRYLQTMVEMASERTSTIIPIPLDMFGLLPGLLGRSNSEGAGDLSSRE